MGEIEILGADDLEIMGVDEDDYSLILGEDDELDYLVLGEDDEDSLADIMGRRPPRDLMRKLKRMGRRIRKGQHKAVRDKALAKAALAQKKAPTRSRELILGFDSIANVGAGVTLDITSRPQVVFRPDRVVVPATIAPNFLIVDIRVGKNSQFTASQPVPAEVFSQGGFQVGMKMDTAQISQDVVMRVTNTSAGALRFNAAMIGPALE
jgi:hypothetical protein